MVDNFYDPDEFYNFRTDNQNINILANFYNTLNASSNFDVLTSFNQAIDVDIDDFNGDQRFYYNSDEFIDNSQSPTINIKALQLNQKAYEFYNIKVEEIPELHGIVFHIKMTRFLFYWVLNINLFIKSET